MQELSIGLKAAVLTLLGFQLIVVSARIAGNRRVEVAAFTALLLAAGLRAVVPSSPSHWRELSGFLLLYSGGGFLALVTGDARRVLWGAAVPVLGLAFLLIGLLGFHDTAPFTGLLVFAGGLAAAYPLGLLVRLWRSTRSAVFPYLMGVVGLGVGAAGWGVLAALPGGAAPSLEPGPWVSLLLLGGTGYLLTGEGYLRLLPWTGLVRRLGLQEQRIRSARSRLVESENTLVLQDRLIGAGLLAAGAAHEFKNTLATIALLAEHGLSRPDPQAWRAGLGAVAENVEVGRRTAVDLLEKLAPQQEAAPEAIRLRDDLAGLLKLVRAACRPEGIRIEAELDGTLAVLCRRRDLEQVLLNLLRNALESLRRGPAGAGRIIRLRAERGEGGVVLDVEDNGEGVPPEMSGRIFEPSVSGARSTGLGLYLSRMLARRNGGTLESLPVPAGSCFRLVLPPA